MKIKKSIKRIFMFLMARLVACTNIDEFEQLFTALCMVCLAKRIYPEIQQYLSKIEKAIKSKEEEIDKDFDYIAELDEELTNDMGDSNSYKSKSPFGRYFNSVLIKCQERIDQLEILHKTTSLEDNDNYFLPRLPTFLATHYIPICPLWTSLILGPVMAPNESNVGSSNAIAENWMRILKINILQNQTKLRPGDFLRKMREGMERRIRAFGFAFEPLSSKILKTKISHKIKDNKLAEEIWQRRKKNKTTYFMANNSQIINMLKHKTNIEINGCKSTVKADILKPVGKAFGNKRTPIIKKKRKSITLKKDRSSLKKMNTSASVIASCINSEVSGDSSPLDNTIQEVTYYDHGDFSPVNKIWRREKCKFLQLTYVCGVLYENESAYKKLQIRELRPSKEKRISPDGNCLFRSISYVITGSDHYHQEIRELLVRNMRAKYREECTKYCYTQKDILLGGVCCSIEKYIQKSKIDRNGSWGTDQELFLTAILLKTDIFVYRDSLSSWIKFSAHGFINKHDVHPLTEKRLYFRLHMNHYQPVVKVNSIVELNRKSHSID